MFEIFWLKQQKESTIWIVTSQKQNIQYKLILIITTLLKFISQQQQNNIINLLIIKEKWKKNNNYLSEN